MSIGWGSRRRVLGLAVVSLLAGCGASAARGDRAHPPRSLPSRSLPAASLAPTIASQRGTRDYEYVLVDGEMYVYDIGRGQRLVQQLPLPGIASVRGVEADIRTHLLYISYGGDGGSDGDGSLAAYGLLHNRILWRVNYSRGVDSFALTRGGRRIYMPEGERSPDGVWSVLDARNGSVLDKIDAGVGPHNTVVGLSGREVYLGPRNTNYLFVASTRTDRIVRRVGPLYSGVRPFTINGRGTLAFTTATGLLGFQVSSLVTGRVLYTEGFGRRFAYPSSWPLTAPSHGISLSPDERRLWVIDTPNAYVHVFDVTGLPRRRPRMIASIALSRQFTGQQSSCSQDCERDGWLQNSLNGCFVYVGDSGDVLSTTTLRRVGYLPALRESREFLEIDWRRGVPVATSTKSGLGYLVPGSRSPRLRCRGR